MADYDINAVTRRVVYDGSSGLGPYAFSFEILASADITVYFNASVLTITTDYTVTINANGTGSVNIVTGGVVSSTPTASDQITIVGSRDIERTTDFVTAGDLRASALNEQLDGQIIMIQQVAEENARGMRAPVYDPALVADGGVVDMTLPTKTSRAGKTLAFDSNGNPIVGEDIGNWRGNWAASVAFTVRDLVKDASNSNVYRVNTAHTSSGSTPISSNTDVAKFDLVVDAAAAGASAAAAAASAAEAAADAILTAADVVSTNADVVSTNADVVSTNADVVTAGSSSTAAQNAQAAAELAYDNFDDRYLGAKASDPTVDNDGDALIDGALYFDTTNNAMKVYDLGTTAWLRTTPTGTEQTNINTVSGISANVTTVAGISSDVTTVAGISSDVTTVAADGTDIGTVAGISANVTTVAGISGNVTTVAGVSANVTTVAGISANVTTVAGDSADIQAVAGNATNINAVAGDATDIGLVAGSIANVNTTAANIADVNNFASTYRIGATDPTGSLDEGDLFYNTTSNSFKYYNGSSWTSIESGLTDIVGDTSPQLGGDLDLNSNDITGTGAIPAANLTGTLPAIDGSALTGINTATNWQSTIVTGTTLSAVAGNGYWINTTSNECTITFPASASVGDTIELVDYARTWGTNKIIIDSNGLNYQGEDDTYYVEYDTSGQGLKIVYSGATQGWIPTSDEVSEDNPVQPIYDVDFLVIAGGGGGGHDDGGGGGAGGYRNSYASEASGGGASSETELTFSAGTTYTITVGAGGAGAGTGTARGVQGSASSISGSDITDITTAGGGGGGSRPSETQGGSGGSGGGNNYLNTGSGGSGTSNQGFAGGAGDNNSSNRNAGGGGGALEAGNTDGAGTGGDGLASSITGSSVTRGGGASGATRTGSAKSAGDGGGGVGRVFSFPATLVSEATSGTANTGGGGGGGSSASSGGTGGSGVVILRMPTARYSGTTTGTPSVSTDGSDTILTYTGSGSYTA